MQRVLDCVWEHLLPALSGPGEEKADAALADGPETVRARAGFGRWITTGSDGPIAGSCGWTAPATLEVQLAFLDTPRPPAEVWERYAEVDRGSSAARGSPR